MREQLELFGMFCLLGMGAAETYDGLRLIRRQRPCGLLRVSVEDALFWLALAAGTFGIFDEKDRAKRAARRIREQQLAKQVYVTGIHNARRK